MSPEQEALEKIEQKITEPLDGYHFDTFERCVDEFTQRRMLNELVNKLNANGRKALRAYLDELEKLDDHDRLERRRRLAQR